MLFWGAIIIITAQPISDPVWPGDAFPPLPWSIWSLRESTSGFFLGNTSGQNSPAETVRESSLGVVGLGWQLGLRNGTAWVGPGGLEARQHEAAKFLKAHRPSVKVMVSAELDATCPLWSTTASLLQNLPLAREVFMTHKNGSIWLDNKWGGLFEQPWYNWSSQVAVQWWIDQGPIASALADPLIDGVFLDGADPDPSFYATNFASPAEVRAFKDAQQKALAQAVLTWRARQPHKWLGGYAAPRVNAAQAPNHCPVGSCAGPEQLSLLGSQACASTMRLLISRSNWTNQTLIIAIPKHDPHPWIPLATFDCERPWWSQNCTLHSSRDPSPEVGAFLVARGPSALLQLVMQPDHTLDYQDHSLFPSLRLEPGYPLEQAREIMPGLFERRWSSLKVRFDCSNYTATFSTIDNLQENQQ